MSRICLWGSNLEGLVSPCWHLLDLDKLLVRLELVRSQGRNVDLLVALFQGVESMRLDVKNEIEYLLVDHL